MIIVVRNDDLCHCKENTNAVKSSGHLVTTDGLTLHAYTNVLFWRTTLVNTSHLDCICIRGDRVFRLAGRELVDERYQWVILPTKLHSGWSGVR